MTARRLNYPFPAIVGQEKMKTGLILNVINPQLSGILIRGEKGTAKSTAVRSPAEILPEIEVVDGCPFQCDPDDVEHLCPQCREQLDAKGDLPRHARKVKVVELPISATEDRVVGTLDLEHALREGKKRIEPGILAAAHRGILYVDEVNLLDDHVVDVLLDSAAMGVNVIEREGVSFAHQARFTLVGTMNPEEGELRPQLLDRFGLCVQVEGLSDASDRVEVVKRRGAFEQDAEAFSRAWQGACRELSEGIVAARKQLPSVEADDGTLLTIAERCLATGVDGHRSDIIMLKAAKTICAYRGGEKVTMQDIEDAAELALPHRVRRRPFEEIYGAPSSEAREAARPVGAER